jgi:GT2 family glycosyltransferase
MISIITRCYNRLEYTIQTLNNVRITADMDYEHIIVDQASTDGTHEWFLWISKNISWYKNIKYIRLEKNLGDWGGMVEGYNYINDNSKYIVQLDNDRIIECNDWMSSMVYVLKNTSYKIVMLHRNFVEDKWKLKSIGQKQIINKLEIAKIERAVGCFMMERELFGKALRYVKNSNISKYQLSRFVKGQVAKILNRYFYEIDTYEQRIKYNPKNRQVWSKL